MEVNLLKKYPLTKRDTVKRNKFKTKAVVRIARKFGREFFDGDRKYGYGGHYYKKKFWYRVCKDIISFYKLSNKSSILDVGCSKGFMLYEFKKILPKIKVIGIDVSRYAIKNSKKEIKKFLKVGDAKKLKFKNNSFDLVISINTIHNLPLKQCEKAIREITRVSKKNAFIIVDAYNNTKEKKKMLEWNLTAKTIMSKKNWKKTFSKNKYFGDYYWFSP